MKTKIERATEIHRTMTPHQMALRIVELEDIAEIVGQSASERSKRIVELQDALELADEAVRAYAQGVKNLPHDDLLSVLKAVVAHSAPYTINGVVCAAFPWVEYEALAARLPK